MNADHLRGLRASSATLSLGAGSTIRGPVDEHEVPAPTARLGGAYTCFDTLGTGGTAVVRRAHQAVLDREVAIKTPLRGASSPAMVARVLQEAWVTGALEHPGVVPIHDVVVDDDGCPHIVMRRIAGWTWTELLNRPEEVPERFGTRDTLGWHLRVLMAVAATVHHAHGRGVLHRDLKPDNVMIGSAGEAYVLDWGIAVALDDRAAHRLPRAAEQDSLAGTPHFMAPEMARGEGAALGPATDVYLLGGLLYAVLARAVPHPGDDVQAVVDAAASRLPDPPPGPARLRSLCMQALSLDPAGRPATAEGFRRAVQDYLEVRDADALVEAGQAALAVLRALPPAPAEPAPDPEAVAPFAAARLAFEQALTRAPGHPEAVAALREARLLVVRRELARGAAAAAARELVFLPDAPPALVAEVAAATEAAERHAAESRRLLAEHDPGAGVRTRSFVSLLLGAVLTLGPLYAALGHRDAEAPELAGGITVVLLFAMGLWLWARDSLSRSVLNRAVIRTVVAAPLLEIVLLVGADPLGLPPRTAVVLFPLLSAGLCFALAASMEPWMLVAAVGFVAAFLGGAWVPTLRWELLTASNMLLASVALARWGPEGLRSWLALRASRSGTGSG